MKRNYYFYRGEVIERFHDGYCISSEMVSGKSTGIPCYKTIEDAKNGIRKMLDGTQKAEPRIIHTVGWNKFTSWYIEQ